MRATPSAEYASIRSRLRPRTAQGIASRPWLVAATAFQLLQVQSSWLHSPQLAACAPLSTLG
jgi:hypothetical protein